MRPSVVLCEEYRILVCCSVFGKYDTFDLVGVLFALQRSETGILFEISHKRDLCVEW